MNSAAHPFSIRRVIRASVALLYMLATYPAAAQMNPDEEIRSLEGVDEFGLMIDIESALGSDGGLDNSAWREALSSRIVELTGRAARLDIDPTRDPHLYVHVNAMTVGDNLVPFAIEAFFVQMTRLSDGHRMMAVTWETGLVGLVTRNELPQVLKAGLGVVDEFASDLEAADSR